ncbi:hypothetical protein ACIQMP_25520 [Streptomyces sp. NPDC091385]|uniref:hypothetical protein n=1 Tax=Streptomyces sp. NPDC091385 TaxID=3365997 RepID=UPI00381FCF8E
MSVRTHSRTHPATTGADGTRLPWWALVLPVPAFALLLALILNPSDAHAATGEPVIAHLVEQIRTLLVR